MPPSHLPFQPPPSPPPPSPPRILTRELAGGGTSGQVLTSNGPLSSPSFQAASVTAPGGSNTQVQYNNSSAFGGSSGITLNATQVTGMTFSDTTTGNATSTAHGLVVKTPADATQFLNGAATAAYANVKDSDLSTSDITTNNVSSSKHGFAPKGDGNATHYLDGTGAYSRPIGSMILLKANSGTDSSAAATNVDTYAVSGLTSLDTLQIYFTVSAVTGLATAPVGIFSSTDATRISDFNQGSNIAAGNTDTGMVTIKQAQQSTTVYESLIMDGSATIGSGGSAGQVFLGTHTMVTAWTGSWTIALRHNGMAGGGTLRWSWALYKVVGQ